MLNTVTGEAIAVESCIASTVEASNRIGTRSMGAAASIVDTAFVDVYKQSKSIVNFHGGSDAVHTV
jgi:hypothetical protein